MTTFGHRGRGRRTQSPESRAAESKPIAANGKVIERNVSGGNSATPILRIGQLQPHTSVSTATGKSDATVMCDVGGASARSGLFNVSRRTAREGVRGNA